MSEQAQSKPKHPGGRKPLTDPRRNVTVRVPRSFEESLSPVAADLATRLGKPVNLQAFLMASALAALKAGATAEIEEVLRHAA